MLRPRQSRTCHPRRQSIHGHARRPRYRSRREYRIRGFIDAYDADTGKHKWRFYTVPGPGEPGHDSWERESWKIGGAPAWITGVYDRATNQLFLPTGNPSPSNRGEGRAGDNLYSNTLLALNV